MYLDKDDRMLEVVDHMKDLLTHRGKRKKHKTKKLIQKGKEIQKQFALTDDELEDIFDMIAQEHGDI